MIRTACGRRRAGVRLPPVRWLVDVPHGRVILEPDDVESTPDGTLVAERMETGRPTKDERAGEFGDDIYALYLVASGQASRSARVQVRFLSADLVLPVVLKAKAIDTRLGHYDDAIVGIAQGDFRPDPGEHQCPRCAYYFVCPVAEDV
jgi:DNA helicase II / ATP-dependent DNA helicase PcrA